MTEIRQLQGFVTRVLRTPEIELTVIPELGARLISLKNLRTGREWLWQPDGPLKLFRNALGDDFSTSTLVGVDECIPTIAACSWRGRELPDHGEVWSAAWTVDERAWGEGILATSVDLPVSPFSLQRNIRLQDREVRMDYLLTNRSGNDEEYLWALHPLLRLQRGDRLVLPPATRALLTEADWVDALDAGLPDGGCCKTFAGPLADGAAGTVNAQTGDHLSFEWYPAENNTLGLWLTCGGWHGHHHFAIEPTNGAPDPLSEAAPQGRCGRIPAFGSVRWSVTLRLGR